MEGRPGTAMKPFRGILTPREAEAVVDYVRRTFMIARAPNTAYHITENGWPDHARRYAEAFPFVEGRLALSTPVEKLTPVQRRGRQLFLSACVTCHEAAGEQDKLRWDPRAVSYPRAGYSHRDPLPAPDTVSSATPYSRHDRAPAVADLSDVEREGESLYQQNCAFCHAADGTGRNWIGTFLEPHPRDLTRLGEQGMDRARLAEVIREGLPGTTMPAWRSVLTDRQIDAIVAYVSRVLADLPAGRAARK